ncbi:unnamed protein product, partial [marine sediment metagenome]
LYGWLTPQLRESLFSKPEALREAEEILKGSSKGKHD